MPFEKSKRKPDKEQSSRVFKFKSEDFKWVQISSPTPVVCKVIKRSEKGLFFPAFLSFSCREQPQIWSYLQTAGARAGPGETSPFWPLFQMLAVDYSSCFQETSNIPVWRMSTYGRSVSVW